MRILSCTALLLAVSMTFGDDIPLRVLTEKSGLKDGRLGKPKDLNDYFPFTPPTSKASWNDRAQRLREQLLVANGLWPMPEKTPIKPLIHGKIERDGYTIEKVSFASMPGHYVTGNLYRPTAKVEGKRPAILNPHGHWQEGRFYSTTDAKVKQDTKDGAEKTVESARYPLQAKCAQLARLGYVTFLYDMVGYADSQAIKHRDGFTDAQAELRLQSFMGLQTWNSIRALDFLASLPDVDPKRIGVTGASGGGTQTFILDAIDDRPMAAFPAVMVSTAMQGGCICENCSYLRVGTGNVEIAGLFAPKPMAMSGANDWTKEIETKGLPELKKLYALLGAEDKVAAKCWPQYDHNYNQVSREFMYSWFNMHILGGTGPVAEVPFKPVPPKELSVYDAVHPRPADELNAKALREKMTLASEAQIKALEPKDEASLKEYRRVVGTAFRVMLDGELPKQSALAFRNKPEEVKLADGVVMHLAAFGRKDGKEAIPCAGVYKGNPSAGTVIWIHPNGKTSLFEKGVLIPSVKALVEKGYAVVAPDVFQVGELKSEKSFPVDKEFAGYTYGYNRSVFANRVQDILTIILFAKELGSTKIHLVGWENAGPWVVAAKVMAGEAVSKTAVDLNHFRFESITSTSDENLLPGASKYGGLGALLALCAPGEVFAHNHEGTGSGQLSQAAYKAAGAESKLHRERAKASQQTVVEWLMK